MIGNLITAVLMNKWTDGEGATADKADDVEWNKKNWCEVGRQEAQILCNSWWLAEQMVCWHSLWANEEPVQPYPCQQQHDNTDGQAQQQPVPKVDAVAVRVNPEFKDSKHNPYMDWDIFYFLPPFIFLFCSSRSYAQHVRRTTHWFRYSEKMRLGDVPGSVLMPPMLEE